jgi:hypothetical protein
MRTVSSVTALRLLFAARVLVAVRSLDQVAVADRRRSPPDGQTCDLPAGHCAGGDQGELRGPA